MKQLVGDLPTGVRGLKVGQDHAQEGPARIRSCRTRTRSGASSRRFESHDERIELNLYIVGENAADEEGAMAEGSQES